MVDRREKILIEQHETVASDGLYQCKAVSKFPIKFKATDLRPRCDPLHGHTDKWILGNFLDSGVEHMSPTLTRRDSSIVRD